MKKSTSRRSKPVRGPRFNELKKKRDRAFVRARFYREMLIRSLGAQCAECFETEVAVLTIDHPDGITWDRRKLRYDARVARYVAEWAEGTARLRVLCHLCNSAVMPSREEEREPGTDDAIDTRRFTAPDPDVPF